MKAKAMIGWKRWNLDEPVEVSSVCVAVLSTGKQIGYLTKPWNPTTVIGSAQYGGLHCTKAWVMKRMGYAEAGKGDKAKMTKTYNLFVAYMLSIGLSVPQE